ncbi:hypothetical protein BA895_18495 [Humibacillus sp. DSM 29435]|uniref:SigE family RNA polymerase sigma factor n=1 Tax=Humibacillus sp. DSM 29435 TaxID=1869167 RepID=UPI0008721DDA|nr:SigE family RNA polymerase sigma factor [Humibacillus sp. DSM 29435]OFE16962.1 hypothetical protein BA895_18495 [Humibacillus sp. DSM 29435]
MEATFEAFVRARGPALLRYAHLLCGDAGRAEDLVQDALVKVYRRWGPDIAAPSAYTRRAITNEYLSWRRRLTNREVPTQLPEPATRSHTDAIAERDAVWRVLAGLPRRQRVVIVLRYYEALPDREIADLLGLAEGSVRSLAARAFATLRAHPELRDAASVDRASRAEPSP